MKEFFFALLSEVESSLDVLNSGNVNVLELAEKATVVLYQAIAKLKEFVRDYEFKDGEEILFFKEMKPQLCSKLLFYKSLWRIESFRPRGHKEVVKQYLLKEIDGIYAFHEKHKFIYQYYVTGATHFDEVFFVRGKCPLQMCEVDSSDDFFTTLCDMKFAELQANESLLNYLQNEINLLDNLKTLPLSFNLKWVFPKRALVQLIYALYAKHCFGEKTTIKEITDWLEATLDIDLKDVYHTYKDFKERTLNPVNFLEELQEALLKKIEADENSAIKR